MTRLEITEPLLNELIDALTPLVEDATGWRVDRAGLQARVLARDRAYEEILLGRMQGAGVQVDPAELHGPLLRLAEYLLECNILAAYEPSRNELMVVRENVDESNLDGLRVVVAHEMVHRAQHINQPALFACIDRDIRDIFALLQTADGVAPAMAKVEALQPVMTLLESHAAYVQEMLHLAQFPAAVIETHYNLPALLARLLGARKLAQYRDGLPGVAEAVERGDIASLYAQVGGV